MEDRLHAHCQIMYPKENNTIESLIGFSPLSKQDREGIHAILDEYLDNLATIYTQAIIDQQTEIFFGDKEREDSEEYGFHIYPFLDKH